MLMVYAVLGFVFDAVRKNVGFLILAQIEEAGLLTRKTHSCLTKAGDITCTIATWSFNVFLSVKSLFQNKHSPWLFGLLRYGLGDASTLKDSVLSLGFKGGHVLSVWP